MSNFARIESERGIQAEEIGVVPLFCYFIGSPTLTPYLSDGIYRILSTAYTFTSNVSDQSYR